MILRLKIFHKKFVLGSTLLCYSINIPTFSHYTQHIHSVVASVQYEAFVTAFFKTVTYYKNYASIFGISIA